MCQFSTHYCEDKKKQNSSGQNSPVLFGRLFIHKNAEEGDSEDFWKRAHLNEDLTALIKPGLFKTEIYDWS